MNKFNLAAHLFPVAMCLAGAAMVVGAYVIAFTRYAYLGWRLTVESGGYKSAIRVIDTAKAIRLAREDEAMRRGFKEAVRLRMVKP